ncbi:MAG: cupin [Candidatus Moraniibacteriota bacterium]|jgi:quercetin dioxygenase-like cupin family protein
MKTADLLENLNYTEDKPVINVLFETQFTKEIRIVMKEGQIMNKHQTPFAIVVEIVEGKIDFGVQGEMLNLERGALLALEGDVPHDLKAIEDSVVRLTLTKSDESKRVQDVIDE